VPVDSCDVRNFGDWLRLWGTQLLPAVWPLGVEVRDVFGHHRHQVTSAEDQHAVSKFGSDGAYESFRVGVRFWALRRNSHHLDSRVGKHGIE
jgi:hypothetical protein